MTVSDIDAAGRALAGRGRSAQVALGTVQFGMPYGVADDGGPPTAGEIAAILAEARRAGVVVIDTAPSYGGSEALLGGSTGGLDGFRIVTKTRHFGETGSIDDPTTGIRATLRNSIRALRVDRVAALLIHNPADAIGTRGSAIFDRMRALREEGLTEKIGLSVYEPSDLASFGQLDSIDIVQLPLNVLDQRMLRSGWIARLKDRGIEVHARSSFLQGLLCIDPAKVSARHSAALPALRRFHADRGEAGLTAPAACLAFVSRIAGVDAVVVGVKSVAQFADVLTAAAARWEADFSVYAVDDPEIVDPRRWNR